MEFEILSDHLKLLQHMYVGWEGDEYGAPEIDPKRPYGNSSVEYDIADILKWEIKDGELSFEQREKANELHLQTEIALQICLITQKFEIGLFEKKGKYDQRSWVKIS